MRKQAKLSWLLLVFLPLQVVLAQGLGTSRLSASDYLQIGKEGLLAEDWYAAAEAFLEALRLNPRYAEPTAGLAECYFALGEYDQALTWVQKARVLKADDLNLANLEAAIQIARGNLAEAEAILVEVFRRQPYNREALFTAAELDLARGRIGQATLRYREAVQRYPDDRHALLSLALVLGSLGDFDQARLFAERAVKAQPDDPKTLYYAAFLESLDTQLDKSLNLLNRCLVLRPDYQPALSLLATVFYYLGDWEAAARTADSLISFDRQNTKIWYLKALAYIKLDRRIEARRLLSTALTIDPKDEFARVVWEQLLLADTGMESAERLSAAKFHFAKAKDFRAQNLIDQALFEYRRGLRLNPYAQERTIYADLLGSLAYPARQLSELRFLQELGQADQTVNDAVEAYDSLLADALHRRWALELDFLDRRHWRIAVITLGADIGGHVDAGQVAADIIKEYLVHNNSLAVSPLAVTQDSFAQAFKAARLAEADYFLIVQAKEGLREIVLEADLYVGRTGSQAANYSAYRSGDDRLRDSARRIVDALEADLPFRSGLIVRKAGQGIIDKGKIDGVQVGQTFDIVLKGCPQAQAEGLAISYAAHELLGQFTVTELDEEIALGTIKPAGFYDKITEGDEVIATRVTSLPTTAGLAVNPELQRLLRELR